MSTRKPVKARSCGEALGLKLLQSVREMKARNFARATEVRSRRSIWQSSNEGDPMPKIDEYEAEVLSAFEMGKLKRVATKAGLAKFKVATRATAVKDRRVNIRLSSGDLSDIQAKALEQGIPYQTLIANVLHQYVTGHLAERTEATAAGQQGHAAKRRRGLT